MNADTPSCHGLCRDLVCCSSGTAIPRVVHRLLWYLEAHGWRRTAARMGIRVLGFVGIKGSSHKIASPAALAPVEDTLDLQPGEWVEVKSEQEIRNLLDADGRYRGLLWMDNMSRFCGRRLRVYKRLERMMLESDGRIRKLKNTVLLEGATCENLYRCDRSCFHFWREAWLRRVKDNH